MAEISVETPGSAVDSSSGKPAASKDKSCPFCNQPFTSSSLGRHLDLYIKEKNPKPADGVHHVDEIRKIRGGITRRQARTSSGKRDSSTPSQSKQSSQQPSPSPAKAGPVKDPTLISKTKLILNQPGWEVNGVIRDIPSVLSDDRQVPVSHRAHGKRTSPKNELERQQKLLEAADNAKASELALREVLGSIKAARSRTNPPSPFDFNPFALTFPALTLQCLPPPPTLFSTHTFATATSWSLEPPGSNQYESLINWFRERYRQWRVEFLPQINAGAENENTLDNSNEQLVQQQEEITMRHLTKAFSTWKSLSEKARHDNWRLETLRALARGEEKRKDAERQLSFAQQEIESLRAQVDRLSQCQQPREFILHPPDTLAISKETSRNLAGAQSERMADWDFDSLVTKWRGIVREQRQMRNGLAAQKPLPTTGLQTAFLPTAGGDVIIDSSFSTTLENGKSPDYNNEQLRDTDHAMLDQVMANNNVSEVYGGRTLMELRGDEFVAINGVVGVRMNGN